MKYTSYIILVLLFIIFLVVSSKDDKIDTSTFMGTIVLFNIWANVLIINDKTKDNND